MRGLRALVVGVTVAASLGGGAAAKDSDRVVERRYGCVVGATGGSCRNFVTLKSRAAERYVTVRAVDDSGQPAPVIVGQDLDGDGSLDVERRFCEFTRNFRIRGGIPVHVRIADLRVPPEECGLSTNGVVRVGFRVAPPL